MPNVIALIPARAGSKAVLDKNIRLLGGHNLIAWTIAACRKAKLIDRVVVSTDSEFYANIAKSYNAEVPFLRPAELSKDSSSDYEFVKHALDWFSDRDEEPDYIVHMRPTTPFRNPLVIDEAIEKFIRNRKATALRSIHEMSESAYKTFEIDLMGHLKVLGHINLSMDLVNNARQNFPNTYIANGYVDVLSTEFIRNNGLLHGDIVEPFETLRVTEIDNEEDFKYLEYQLNRFPKIIEEIFD